MMWTRPCGRNGTVDVVMSGSGSHGGRRVPQQPGGQVGEHLGGSAADGQDAGVAVVPLHLGAVEVAGAAVQLHGRVAHARAPPRPRSAWPGRPRRPRPRRRRDERRRRACRSGRPSTWRCISTSRCRTTWRPTSGRPKVWRSCTYAAVRAERPGGDAVRRARPARSARPRTARRSGRTPSPRHRPGWPPGTRHDAKPSSAVSEQCQPIFGSARSTVNPGVPFSTTSSEMPPAPGPPVRTATVTKSARTPLVMKVLVPSTTYVVAVAAGRRPDGRHVGAAVGLGDREGADLLAGQRRTHEAVHQRRRCQMPRCAAARCRR